MATKDTTEVLVEDDDGIEIEVVDDRPEEDRNRPVAVQDALDDDEEMSEDEIEQLGAKTQKRIKKLTWRYHEERRAKEEAERLSQESVHYASSIKDQNQQLRAALKRIQEMYSEERQKSTSSSVQMAEARLAAAYEQGDPAIIAKAQAELTKAQIEGQSAPNNVAINPNTFLQEVDSGQATPIRRPDPKAIEWKSRNQWFGVDAEMTSLAYGIHERLVREGVDPQTDDYYQRLDSRMREIFPHRFDGNTALEEREQSEPVQSRRPSRSVVAPATRNSGGPARKSVQLTQTQVALAKKLGLTPEQYARQLLIEQQGG